MNMAFRLLFLPLGLFVLPGIAGAQSQNVRPAIQIGGEPNGAPQTSSSVPQLLSPERIAQMESQVQVEPENVNARLMLLTAYRETRQSDKAMDQMLWIIGHHPEWNAASLTVLLPKGPNGNNAADYQQLKYAWEGALADHPSNPEVLYNGGLFLRSSEGERALQLFQQARQLQPSNLRYLQAVALMYEAAVVNDTTRMPLLLPLSTELKNRLSAELPGLNDAALLSQVGGYLALTGPRTPDNPNRQLGLRLLERATVLEPDNPHWKAVLETAMNPPAPPASLVPQGAVRIGAAVAEANLIRKIDPIYPALAKSARVSGTVEFTAVVSAEGHIQNLQLVRGHPLLVNAAREAILQYIYRPTMLNGNPVPVVTSISVNFELPAQ